MRYWNFRVRSENPFLVFDFYASKISNTQRLVITLLVRPVKTPKRGEKIEYSLFVFPDQEDS
jgi:hypothetical protein